MNKYLKTYIRNRDIANKSKHNLMLHELDYFNDIELNNSNIRSLIMSTNKYNYDELLNIVGDKIIDYMNDKSTGFYNRSIKIGNTGNKTDTLIRRIIDNEYLFKSLNHYGILGILSHIESEILFFDLIDKIINNENLHNEYNFMFFSKLLGYIEDLIELGYIKKVDINKYRNFINYYVSKFNINEPSKLIERINKILNI